MIGKLEGFLVMGYVYKEAQHCACAWACACERDREREKDGGGWRQSEIPEITA